MKLTVRWCLVFVCATVLGCDSSDRMLDSVQDQWMGSASLTKPSVTVDRPGTLFAGTNNNPAPTGTLFTVDPVTGIGIAVATLAPGPIVSLAFNHADGELYGSTIDLSVGFPADYHLVTIDPQSGAATSRGVFRNAINPAAKYRVAAMGFAHDGSLYAVHALLGGPNRMLIQVDPATAKVTEVGLLDRQLRSFGGTIDDGVFYLLARETVADGDEITLYTVDLVTAVTTEIGGTGIFDNAVGLTVAGDGRMLAVVQDRVYALDRATGAGTLIGPAGFSAISALAFVDEVDRQVPCGGPWKNHGEYVSRVAEVTNAMHKAGLISGRQKGQIQSEAARSDCGKP